MANPNIVGVTTINGNTTSVAASVASKSLINNKASSGKIMKVNTLLATNNATAAVDVTVVLYPQDKLEGAPKEIAHKITVPAQSTLIILDKSTSVYLKENNSIGGNASANSSIIFHTSGEEIKSS